MQDIEIIPRKGSVSWGALKRELENQLHLHSFKTYFQEPISCYMLPDELEMKGSDVMQVNHSYIFERQAGLNRGTPCLSTSDNEDILTELETLENYAVSMERNEVEGLAKDWARVGYSFLIEYRSGENDLGFKTALILAKALSVLTDGYILISDFHIFDCGHGLISCEKFQRTKIV